MEPEPEPSDSDTRCGQAKQGHTTGPLAQPLLYVAEHTRALVRVAGELQKFVRGGLHVASQGPSGVATSPLLTATRKNFFPHLGYCSIK